MIQEGERDWLMNLSGINCVFIQEEITVWSSTNDQTVGIICDIYPELFPVLAEAALILWGTCERGGKWCWWSVGARHSFLQRAENNWNAINTLLSHCISTCGWNKPLSVIPWGVWCRPVMRPKWWTEMWRRRDIELALAPNFTEPNRTGPPNPDAFSMRSVGFRHDASTRMHGQIAMERNTSHEKYVHVGAEVKQRILGRSL